MNLKERKIWCNKHKIWKKVGLNNLVVETDNKKGVDYISFLILKIAQLEKRIEELEKDKK